MEIREESWWLMYCSFPSLNWARLRVFVNGMAEVLDMDGSTHKFEEAQNARNWLLEDEYVSYDFLDTEDEKEYGIDLSQIKVPNASSEKELVKLMYVQVNA